MLYIMLHYTVLILFILLNSRVQCLTARNKHLSKLDPGHDICPPWFIYNETTSKCQCGNDLGGIVKCNDKEGARENAIMDCYCMTHDKKFGTIAGPCFYNCEHHKKHTMGHRAKQIYRRLPLNSSELNEAMCDRTFLWKM